MDKKQWKAEFNALGDEDRHDVETELLRKARKMGLRIPLRDGRRRVDYLWEVRSIIKKARERV